MAGAGRVQLGWMEDWMFCYANEPKRGRRMCLKLDARLEGTGCAARKPPRTEKVGSVREKFAGRNGLDECPACRSL
jgi:hypothetical protein